MKPGWFLLLPSVLIFVGTQYASARHVVVEDSPQGHSVSVAGPTGVTSHVPISFGIQETRTTQGTLTQVDEGLVFDWQLKFSASGKVFKDVSFASPLVGYIATELGAVYKSTDGGESWQLKLNLGFPYYWYGVEAITPDTVIISGFNNQGNINDGVLRWSFDGGSTWSGDIILSIPSGVGWLDRVHFFGPDTGIVMASFSGGVHYTTTGGKESGEWSYVQVNSDQGWFAGNIDAQIPGDVYATGIHLAHSTDFGSTWTSMPSVDGVFDGGIDFLDEGNQLGLTGGGQISAPVQGWLHRTTDGGQNWSDRLGTFPYPIRAVRLLTDSIGLAVGGNVYGESGGIYRSGDAGLTWNLDVQTDAEMFAIEVVPLAGDSVDIWCAGSTGGSTGFTGRLYKTRVSLPSGTTSAGPAQTERPDVVGLLANYPNPFNPSTTFSFSIPKSSIVNLTLFDLLGREVATLVNERLAPGTYTRQWDATGQPSGVYFYRLRAGHYVETKKLVLLR